MEDSLDRLVEESSPRTLLRNMIAMAEPKDTPGPIKAEASRKREKKQNKRKSSTSSHHITEGEDMRIHVLRHRSQQSPSLSASMNKTLDVSAIQGINQTYANLGPPDSDDSSLNISINLEEAARFHKKRKRELETPTLPSKVVTKPPSSKKKRKAVLHPSIPASETSKSEETVPVVKNLATITATFEENQESELQNKEEKEEINNTRMGQAEEESADVPQMVISATKNTGTETLHMSSASPSILNTSYFSSKSNETYDFTSENENTLGNILKETRERFGSQAPPLKLNLSTITKRLQTKQMSEQRSDTDAATEDVAGDVGDIVDAMEIEDVDVLDVQPAKEPRVKENNSGIQESPSMTILDTSQEASEESAAGSEFQATSPETKDVGVNPILPPLSFRDDASTAQNVQEVSFLSDSGDEDAELRGNISAVLYSIDDDDLKVSHNQSSVPVDPRKGQDVAIETWGSASFINESKKYIVAQNNAIRKSPKNVDQPLGSEYVPRESIGQDSATRTSPRKSIGQDSGTRTSPRKSIGQNSATRASPRKSIGQGSATRASIRKSIGQDIATRANPRNSIGQDSATRASLRKSIEQDSATRPSPRNSIGQDSATRASPRKSIGQGSATRASPRKSTGQDSTSRASPRKTIGQGSASRVSLRKSIGLDSAPRASPRKSIGQDSISRASPRESIDLENVTRKSPRKSIDQDSVSRESQRKSIGHDNVAKESPIDHDNAARESPRKSIGRDSVTRASPRKSIGQDSVARESPSKSIDHDSVARASPRKTRKSIGQDSVVRESPSKTIGQDSVARASLRKTRKSIGQDSVARESPSKSIGQDSVARESPSKSIVIDSISRESPRKNIGQDSADRASPNKSIVQDNFTRTSTRKNTGQDSVSRKSIGKNVSSLIISHNKAVGMVSSAASTSPASNQEIQEAHTAQHSGNADILTVLPTARNTHQRFSTQKGEEKPDNVPQLDTSTKIVPSSGEEELAPLPHSQDEERDVLGQDEATTSEFSEEDSASESETEHILLPVVRPSFAASQVSMTAVRTSDTEEEDNSLPVRKATPPHTGRSSTARVKQMTMREFLEKLKAKPVQPPISKPNPLLPSLLHTPVSSNSKAKTKGKPKGKDNFKKKPRLPASIPAYTTKELFSHFAKCRVLPAAMVQVVKSSELFWENLCKDLCAIASSGKKVRSIQPKDVEKLMTRQGVISSEQSLNALVEELLPMEMWSTFMSVTRPAHNPFPPFTDLLFQLDSIDATNDE